MPVLAHDGVWLGREPSGLRIQVTSATPEPGTYEYPAPNMIPDGVSPHPVIDAGDDDNPEVFTLWAFVFNHPELCTDSACDFDDIGDDTAAMGGIFQVDGRVVASSDLILEGAVRVGQPAAVGPGLTNPVGAEVHVAVAPHGRARTGADLARQLNGTVGSPEHWWPSAFIPQSP